MRLLTAEIENFGSYKHLKFDFNNQGLTLIHGNTGAGKSTLQDIVAWTLYGITSKNGSVDDIRNWNYPNSITKSTLDVELGEDNVITVCRERGGAGKNDLYFILHQQMTRGKDILETQKLLSTVLGVDSDLYGSAACYNEFSPGVTFFTAPAKSKRELFDKIAQLELPIKLSEGALDERKKAKSDHSKVLDQYNEARGGLEQLRKGKAQIEKASQRWSENQKRTIEELKTKEEFFEEETKSLIQACQTKHDLFEQNQKDKESKLLEKMEKLYKIVTSSVTICTTCGQRNEKAIKNEQDLKASIEALEALHEVQSPYLEQLQSIPIRTNTYIDSIALEESKINPFLVELENISGELIILEFSTRSLENQLVTLNGRINGFNELHKISLTLRSELLKQAIDRIQSDINGYICGYFDAELTVNFIIGDLDTLDIEIFKNGHLCSYTQLSKGQRTILKLCFSIAIMEAASNKAGVHFETIMFDEALSGLDEATKHKAFNLFTKLSIDHSSVLVIDHEVSFQSMFDKRIHVKLESDNSEIDYE